MSASRQTSNLSFFDEIKKTPDKYNEILDIFKKNYKKKSDEICKTLVEIANDNGGRDNVTVIVSRRNA